MMVQAEVSLYALGKPDLAPAIYSFIRRLERPGLTVEIGRMSTLVTGDDAAVFEALREAYAEVGGIDPAVLVVKVSNFTPRIMPDRAGEARV